MSKTYSFSNHIGEIPSLEGLILDMNVHVSQCPHCPKCVPYTPQACIVAALQNGYKIGGIRSTGYEFAG